MNAVTLTSVFLKSEEQLKQSLQGLRLPKDYVELQKAVNNPLAELNEVKICLKSCAYL